MDLENSFDGNEGHSEVFDAGILLRTDKLRKKLNRNIRGVRFVIG